MSGVTYRIEGADELVEKLNSLGLEGEKAAHRAVLAMSMQVRTTAIRNIQRKQSRGRVYPRGRKKHVASTPGNPPNTDTGALARSIKAIIRKDTGWVGTNLDYGYFLEIGTQEMEARPWLFPSLEENGEYFVEQVQKGINRVVHGLTK